MNDRLTLKQILGTFAVSIPLGMGIGEILFGSQVQGLGLLGLCAINVYIGNWNIK